MYKPVSMDSIILICYHKFSLIKYLLLDFIARLFRNAQSRTCLDFIPPSSSSCTPAILSSCPTDRFLKFSNSLKWDLIPVNPSTNEIIIKSNNNQFCLSAASNAVEVCPCDNGASQLWKLNDDKILSSA